MAAQKEQISKSLAYASPSHIIIIFHPAKCRTMHLGKHNPNTKYTLPMDDGTLHEIAQTAEEKDLGVTIDDKLIFSPTHSITSQQS